MAEKTEGLYGEAQNLKAQNVRFIITTAVVAVLILGIAVWGIIYAIGGGRKTDTAETETETTTSDEIVSDEIIAEETSSSTTVSEDDVLEVTNLKEDTTEEATVETAVTTASENIPKTGPEDVLPVALVLGALVAFAGSAKLAKIKA